MRDLKQTPYLEVSETFWAWAAGLLEGEGSIIVAKTGASIQCNMTDEDVIHMLSDRLDGIGNVTGPYDRSPNKPSWRWGLYARNEIEVVLPRLRPYLGERRREQVDRVMAHLDATRRPEPEHATERMYGRGCRCQPCKTAHARYCYERRHNS